MRRVGHWRPERFDDWGRQYNWDDYGSRYAYMMAYGTPFVSDFFRAYDNYRYYDDYLRSRGMSWNDVKYMGRMSGAGSFGSAGVSVSRNLLYLYK